MGSTTPGPSGPDASDARMRATFETALDCIVAIDHEGRIVEFNRAAERTFGHRRDDVLGRRMVDLLVPPALRDAHRAGMRRHLATGEARILDRRLELTGLRADGEEFPVELTVTRVPGSDPPVFTGWLRDIGDRKRAERRLLTLAGVTRALAESAAVPEAATRILRTVCEGLGWDVGVLWTVDRDSEVLRCSEIVALPGVAVSRFEAITRARAFAPGEGLPGRVWRRREVVWLPDATADPAYPRAPVARNEGLRATFGFPVVLGGRVLGVMEFLVREVRARDDALVGLLLDVGSQLGQFIERTRAEEALRESERRLAVLVADLPGMAYRFRAEGGWTTELVSDGTLAITGWTAEDFLAGRVRWPDVQHPDDAARVRAAFGEAARSGRPYQLEHRIVRRDGEERWVLEQGRAVRRGDEDALAVEGFVTDVTARKRAEEERDALLTSERAARAEAERASRTKDEFLATLSHELRTPLNAILGWAHVLLQGAADAEELATGLRTIERNARAQSRMIDDLLDIGRITSGKVRLEVRRLELADVVRDAVEAVRPAADARGIRLEAVLDEASTAVTGDPGRLQQVVWNLLSNAIKFTPKGGRVQVVLRRVGSHAEVVVADTGQGIRPDFLASVFDRFRQQDSSSTRAYGGLGLGLSIVKQLVELHGGTIRAASGGEGKGATFTVELPLRASAEPGAGDPADAPPAVRAVPAPHLGEGPTLRDVRVLVVDDEPDSRELVRRVLEGRGAVVATAASVDEAIDRFEEARPHVLLSDVGMPGRDGLELVRWLRARTADEGGRTPAAALTALARADDRRRALLAGYQLHLAKPVEPAELVAAVASLAGLAGRSAGAAG